MFGSHLSIAGGMHNALLDAERLSFDTVQVFTKNQQQWKFKPLDPTAISAWAEHRDRLKFFHTVSHDSYLINLASPDEALWRRGIGMFAEEIRRCAILKIPYLVTHPGAHMGSGEDAGLARVAEGLDLAIEESGEKTGVVICLEITAGQGSSLGYRLEHLATIIELSKNKKRVGVCLDTCHLFSAGYDFRGRKFASFRRQLDDIVGLSRVKVLHLNDSKTPLGSRVDRHEHIGLGSIGDGGFKPFVREAAFAHIPKILETAKDEAPDGRGWDAVNLERLKGLM